MVGTPPRTPPLNPDDAVGPGGGEGGGGDQLNPLQPPGPPLGQLQQGQQPGQIPTLQVPQGPLASPQDVGGRFDPPQVPHLGQAPPQGQNQVSLLCQVPPLG